MHLTPSDNGSVGGGSGPTTGTKDTTSLVQKAPLPFLLGGSIGGSSLVDKVPSPEQFVGSDGNALPESALMLLKLQGRLGRILQEACDLNKQIGHLLAAVVGQST